MKTNTMTRSKRQEHANQGAVRGKYYERYRQGKLTFLPHPDGMYSDLLPFFQQPVHPRGITDLEDRSNTDLVALRQRIDRLLATRLIDSYIE